MHLFIGKVVSLNSYHLAERISNHNEFTENGIQSYLFLKVPSHEIIRKITNLQIKNNIDNFL